MMHKEIIVLILLSFLFTGCTSINMPVNPAAVQTLDPFAGTIQAPPISTQPLVDNPKSNNPIILTVWIPDNFPVTAPEQTQALLIDRLETFEKANSSITVDMRIKSVQQKESLMELLQYHQSGCKINPTGCNSVDQGRYGNRSLKRFAGSF